MKITIREASLEDYQALCDLYAEVDDLHYQALPYIFQPADQCVRSADLISKTIASEEAALFVAESEDPHKAVVGFVQVKIKQVSDGPILKPRKFGWISDIVVGRSRHRSGVGRLLMAQAQRWLLDKNITQVQLNVWGFNQAAIRFYESLGYTLLNQMMTLDLSSAAGKSIDGDDGGA